MTGDVNQLMDFMPGPGDLVVHVPNMGPMRVLGSGFVSTPFMSLQNVLYIPGLDKNLVSVSLLAEHGCTITSEMPGIIGGGTLYVSQNPGCTCTPGATASSFMQADWIYDSGASQSSTGNVDILKGLHYAVKIVVDVANGQTNSSLKCGHTSGSVNLDGIRFFPGSPNLISAGHLARLGCEATLKQDCIIITKNKLRVGYGRRHQDNLYHVYYLDPLGSICEWCLVSQNQNQKQNLLVLPAQTSA